MKTHAIPSLLLLSAATLTPGCRQDPAAPALTLPKAQIYESLRGNPFAQHEYRFAVSPDEVWLAAIPIWGSGRDVLRILHRPTGRTWDAELPLPSDGAGRWFPACFSRDSQRVVLATVQAQLRPGMDRLVLRPLEGPREARTTTCLDIPAEQRRPGPGLATRRWGLASMQERFGTVETSRDGRIRYEARTQGQAKSSFLDITPGAKAQLVDHSRHALLLEQNRAEARKLRQDAPPGIKALGALLGVRDGDRAVRLSRLCVSPDGKYLAAIASTSRGIGDTSVGVIIPLDRGGLVAYPYAERVYGRVVWAADSGGFYFYAQSLEQGHRGTVHRLQLADMQFGAAGPARRVPEATLRAPSDAELSERRHQTRKATHYAALARDFRRPQQIVEVWRSHLLTASGHVLFLGSSMYSGDEQTEAWLRAHCLHQTIRIELPPESEFVSRYIPGCRTGRFGKTARYPWRAAPDKSNFGMVPVRLGEGGKLSEALERARQKKGPRTNGAPSGSRR